MRKSLLILALLSCSPAWAVPTPLTTQGRLMDADGVAVEGTLELTFRLTDAEVGGEVLWSATQTVDFRNGYYAALLGADESSNPLTDEILDQWPVWLEIQVSGQPPMAPRSALSSAPYARLAGRAEEVIGGVVDARSLRVGGVEVVDASGAWVGAPTAVEWGALTSVPGGFADGLDDDQLSSIACLEGQGLVFSGVSGWACGVTTPVSALEAELLALDAGVSALTLTCDGHTATIDTLAGRVGVLESGALVWTADLDAVRLRVTALESVPDSDTLAALACGDGELVRWDGALAEWVCAPEVDEALSRTSDALSSLGVRLTTVEADASALEATVGAHSGLIAAVDRRLDTAVATLTALDGRIGALAAAGFSGSFSDLYDVPMGVSDGDDDSLGALACLTGQGPRWTMSSGWECADDQTRTDSEIVAVISSAPALDLRAGATVAGSLVLTATSWLSEAAIDASGADDGDVLVAEGGAGAWRGIADTDACVRVASGGSTSLRCGGVLVSLPETRPTIVDMVRGPFGGWVTSDGTVSIARAAGQRSTTLEYSAVPAKVVAGPFVLALMRDGRVELDAAYLQDAADAVAAQALLSGTYRDVAASNQEVCVLSMTGAVQCIVGTTPPTLTTRVGSGATALALPMRTSLFGGCAVLSTGAAQCWGATASLATRPGPFVSLSTSEYVTCGVTTAGLLQCWGSISTPPPTTGTYTKVVHRYANQTGCALSVAGEAVCWGTNVETPPAGPLTDLFQVGEGLCARRADRERPICFGNTFDPGW
jgi:hypothetical protein